jgi:hypothetical protein
MLDGGQWSVRLVDATGRVVTSFDSGDAGVDDAWAGAARDGIVGVYDPPDGFGILAFAGPALMTWTSTGGKGLSVAYDFEGGILVVKRSPSQQTWQRFDDLGNELTPDQPLPAAMTGGLDWAAIDVQGNVLGAWQQDGGASIDAQWFGPDLAPLGSVFPLGSSPPFVEPLAERGFALSSSADDPELWTGVLDPFASAVAPVPSFRLDRGTRAQWPVFSGKAYAFSDASCAVASWPCPTASAEIVAADGTSCGSLTMRNADGSARSFILTRGGTIIDPEPQPPGSYRWWPGVLR